MVHMEFLGLYRFFFFWILEKSAMIREKEYILASGEEECENWAAHVKWELQFYIFWKHESTVGKVQCQGKS